MTHQEIRRAFLDFFRTKGHTVVLSASLIPTDPSVLFTTAGMQQFKPYYLSPGDAERDFDSRNVVSIQKCLRTSDIDEVGDDTHLTFFEMLGNFSFGGYGKKEAIVYAHEFITQTLRLVIGHVAVFAGEGKIPADVESEKIWTDLDPNIQIRRTGKEETFWGPTGDEGPCGPTTEIYVDGVEVWNIVFNEYYQEKDGRLRSLETFGIDTGMGLERLTKTVQKAETVFETDIFRNLLASAEFTDAYDIRARRIVADHVRAIAFLVLDGIRPSNKEQGYVLRRLIRRVATLEHLRQPLNFRSLVTSLVSEMREFYPELSEEAVIREFEEEKGKFLKTLQKGIRELERLPAVDAASAFRLYQSFGLPFEVIREVAGAKAAALSRDAFEAEFERHQAESRKGTEKKFGGHGLILDTGELKAGSEEEVKIVTRLHTATHLLQAALRKVLGETVSQAGSDITAERLRFDFTFPRKLTAEEVRDTEDLVNNIIRQDLPVEKQTLPQDEALTSGALHASKARYPDFVDIYSIGDFSKEFCGGPHVGHTGEIGTVRILKEEAVSAGVRRIRAALENS